MSKRKISPSGSWHGYSWKTWAKGHAKHLRLFCAGVLGLLAMSVSRLPQPWALALGGVVSTGSLLALDALDFYLSDVSLE